MNNKRAGEHTEAGIKGGTFSGNKQGMTERAQGDIPFTIANSKSSIICNRIAEAITYVWTHLQNYEKDPGTQCSSTLSAQQVQWRGVLSLTGQQPTRDCQVCPVSRFGTAVVNDQISQLVNSDRRRPFLQ